MEKTSKYTKEEAQAIAGEIRNQLGVKALFLLGAKNLGVSIIDESVAFTFKIAGSKIKYIAILYRAGLDLYEIRFVNGGGQVVETVEGVYSEMFRDVIEKSTGLYTSI